MSSEKLGVVIIGAGMAGLSAAEHLQSNGFESWKILEATGRCGGRMKSSNFGSSFVEEGANWIHGASYSNSIFLFANQHKLISSPPMLMSRKDQTYFNTDGSVINPNLTKKAYDLFKKLEIDTTKLHDRNRSSMYDFMLERFESFQGELEEGDRKQVKCLLRYFSNYVSVHAGDDDVLVPAWGYGAYDEIPGGDVRLPKGYGTFINKLLSKLPTEQIILNNAVVNINWNSDPIIVQCSNGEELLADSVLVTVPLGVLKAHKDKLFTPDLTTEKQQAIEQMGFGRVCKIFLEYDHPFWQPGSLGVINLTWNDNDLSFYKESGELWVTKLLGFEEIPYNSNVLFCWLGGSQAPVVESLPEEHLKVVMTKILGRFLGNPTIPAPGKILVTRWCLDPWTRGSYSYPSLDSKEGDISKLAEPVVHEGKVRIRFAGEATHPRYFSTVHGARSSGIREAEAILEVNKAKLL